MAHYTLNLNGKLLDLSQPIVMGIINLTPDSFYQPTQGYDIPQMVADGASIIDIGACSTRPNALIISEEEEWKRLSKAAYQLSTVNCQLSIDTFRPSIAKRAVQELGFTMVNDISGGCDEMYETVAALGVPYVLTHNEVLQEGDIIAQMIDYLQYRIDRLHQLGVKDVVVDAGFGFKKTIAQNFEILNRLEQLQVLDCPVLVGVSHKSMIYKTLNCTPAEALNGTTVLHTLAIQKGANILRVHEVKEAQEVIKLTNITLS